MTIAFVGAADLGNNGGSGTLSTSYTCGSGSNRLLVVAIQGNTGSDSVTGATYNGNALTLAAKTAPVGGGSRWCYLYYLLGPATGSNTLAITTSAGFILAGAADYSGVEQSGQPDATATKQSATSAASITQSITTTTNNTWVVMTCGGYRGNIPPAAGTGSTRRTYDATFGTYGLFDSNADVPTGSYSMSADYGGSTDDGITLVMAAFKPATGGGGVFSPIPYLQHVAGMGGGF